MTYRRRRTWVDRLDLLPARKVGELEGHTVRGILGPGGRVGWRGRAVGLEVLASLLYRHKKSSLQVVRALLLDVSMCVEVERGENGHLS